MLYDRNVVTKPLEFPKAWVAQIRKSTLSIDRGLDSSPDAAVKVADYPELANGTFQATS